METLAQPKTSQEWWDSIKNDPELIKKWLVNQYHGEAVASQRIKEHILPFFETAPKSKAVVERIAADEEKHAKWIATLLENRGLTAEILKKEERYWNEVINEEFKGNGQYAAAAAAHAEEMRLERIEVLCTDPVVDSDIKMTFLMILKDEKFHAKAFKSLGGEEYYNESAENHAKGMEALGLII